MSYTLLTLPYTALPCVIITVNNLQGPVQSTVHVLLVVFTVKSMGSFYSERSVEKLLGVLNQFYARETLRLETLKQYRQKGKQKAKWSSIEEDDHDASSTRKQNAMRAAV